MKLDAFVVENVMVHDVPRGNDETESPTLTDDPIELDDELRRYFRRKITTSLTERGVEVVADPDEDSTTREAIAEILRKPTALPDASPAVALHLNDVQTARNPAGLLAVVTGVLDGTRCVSVLKLEREQGLRFRIHSVGGRQVVDLQLLRDLTLTDKTKVFKTSIFRNDGAGAAGAASIVGQVSDDQRGSEIGGVAAFWLGRFLGCRLKDNPEKTTLEFVEAFTHFANEDVPSPDRRGRYQVALLATMQSKEREIQPRKFARAHLERGDRAPFLARVQDIGLDPDTAFTKDTSLVRVEGFKMTFKNGMVLVGSQEDLSERVHIREDDAPEPGVEVNDAIKNLKGR